METNNLLELLNSLSKVASSLKETKTTSTQPTFSQTDTTSCAPIEKINRQKPTAPKTDAIIKMLQQHNALSRQIAENNK